MKNLFKDLGWGILFASPLIFAAFLWFFFFAPGANAQPQQCVPTYNTVCTGPYTHCNVYFNNCSPIPGLPGTWNPRGYTPCTYDKGCYP